MTAVSYENVFFCGVLDKCVLIVALRRFIARLEEQIHEWKLNTVTCGPPLTKVVATFNFVIPYSVSLLT